MSKPQAEDYLKSLLNKNLRVTTSDTRMFLGQFKCTDSVCVSTTFLYLATWLSLHFSTSDTRRFNSIAKANHLLNTGQEYHPLPHLRVPHPTSPKTQPAIQRRNRHHGPHIPLPGISRRTW
jgi:hypothetical protein